MSTHDDLPDIASLLTHLSWMDQGACRGYPAEVFFPSQGEDCRHAKAICKGCPVRIACREYGIANGEAFGVWGGLSERERRRIRVARRSGQITLSESA